jgi:hypothetical protein
MRYPWMLASGFGSHATRTDGAAIKSAPMKKSSTLNSHQYPDPSRLFDLLSNWHIRQYGRCQRFQRRTSGKRHTVQANEATDEERGEPKGRPPESERNFFARARLAEELILRRRSFSPDVLPVRRAWRRPRGWIATKSPSVGQLDYPVQAMRAHLLDCRQRVMESRAYERRLCPYP